MQTLNQKAIMKNYSLNTRNSGFTLIEMATVILLMGILASLGLSTLVAKVQQTAFKVTDQRLETVKEAMISYLRRNKRLPCPDDYLDLEEFDGKEDPLGGGTCDNNVGFGVLPYSTLGLSRNQVIDGWGNLFSYHVSQGEYLWTLTPIPDGYPGALTIYDTKTGVLITDNVVLVVVSHGPNGEGAFTVKGSRNVLPDSIASEDEYENTDDTSNNIYIQRDFTDNTLATGGAFDDVVLAMTVDDLVSPLIKDESMHFLEVEWIKILTIIKNKLLAYMVRNNATLANYDCNLPELDGSGLGSIKDPWGTNLTAGTTDISAGDYTVYSLGPNRKDDLGGGDDEWQSVLTQDDAVAFVGAIKGNLTSTCLNPPPPEE